MTGRAFAVAVLMWSSMAAAAPAFYESFEGELLESDGGQWGQAYERSSNNSVTTSSFLST